MIKTTKLIFNKLENIYLNEYEVDSEFETNLKSESNINSESSDFNSSKNDNIQSLKIFNENNSFNNINQQLKIKLFNNSKFFKVGCFIHLIHLIINISIRNNYNITQLIEKIYLTIKFFKKSNLNSLNINISLSVETRWNSLYLSIESLLKSKKNYLNYVQSNPQIVLANYLINNDDIKYLIKLKHLLKFFYIATKKLEKDNSKLFEFYNDYKEIITKFCF